MNKIIEILMERDGMDFTEARQHYLEVKEMIYENIDDYDAVEDIMAGELGLEMDYIHDII